jgi:hypothetical protein
MALIRERTILTERPPLVAEGRANFVCVTDRHILGFLNRGHYFSFLAATQFSHEAQWTPLPTTSQKIL